MRCAAEMVLHKALGFPWHVPAFGEEVPMWRSHDKKQAKSAHNKGAVGRLTSIDPWGNGTFLLIAKGADVQDPELVRRSTAQDSSSGLPASEKAAPRIIPDGWVKDAIHTLAQRWQTIQTPE